MKPRAMSWWEPTAKCWPEARAEIRRTFTPLALIRIAALVILIAGAGAFFLRKWVPYSDFNWVLATAKALAAGVAVIAAAGATLFLPNRITVRPQGISVGQGNRHRLLKFEDLTEARVDASPAGYHLLILRLKNQAKPVSLGVPLRIPAADLAAAIEARWHGKVAVESGC